jgi:hypothetical protein
MGGLWFQAGCRFELGDPLGLTGDEYLGLTIVTEAGGGSDSSVNVEDNRDGPSTWLPVVPVGSPNLRCRSAALVVQG